MALGVRIGDEINGKAVTIGESIDMMKGECVAWARGWLRTIRPEFFWIDMEAKSCARAPSDNFGERLAEQCEVDPNSPPEETQMRIRCSSLIPKLCI